MTEAIRGELDRIVGALVETGIVSKIILFGSCASGEESAGSDIDLCVLTPVKDRRPIDIMVELRMKLYGVKKMPLDLLAYNQDDFTARANRPGSFQCHIREHGVVLYG